jgi:GTPase-associated protein 1, N-terminal domain type 2/GTPase-associated protein 1, C-terminal domain/GTPase-associated protein 1, middle domain
VAFQQLYYTSCEHGVGGYVGFQFNALSAGTGPRAMREVEQLTVYELPSWDSSTADAPVNLCHVRDAAGGGMITANVVYVGTDFSGRTGNYFAHALVTGDPETDFGGLLPAELWESPVWSRTQAPSTTLPMMEAPLPHGSLDRPTVAAFLGTQPDARMVLIRLLSAVDKVMNENRSLVLWTSSSTENAHWIAAASYLMETTRAREMSFYTYTRRPAQCRVHVIGTVPGTLTSAAALADSFRVFDLTSRTMPEVEIHPLAELLAQVGVLRAAGLWRQAATLAAGTERSFDEWYPVAAAAAGLLGVEPLPSGAVDAMASWLREAPSRSAPLPGPHIETVLTVLLDRHEELGDDQLRPLLSTAKEAGAVGQLQRIEIILVNRAVTRLQRGEPPQGPIPLATAEGIQLAAAGCESLLAAANAVASMTVLDWARETRLGLDPQLVERCGRDVIGPALPSLDGDRRVVQVGQAYPAFASGVGAYLVAVGTGTAARLFEGIAGELWASGALSGNPELREIGLIEEVKLGKLAPLIALREVIELRPSPSSALSDEYLMGRLWPEGLPTVGDATEMLSFLVGDVRGTPALRLLDRALQAPSRLYDVDAWLKLCALTLDHPVCAQLPVGTGHLLESLRGLSTELVNARARVTEADMTWYEDFHDHIEGLLPPARDVMRQGLARLTLEAVRPAQQLATCSDPVFGLTCDQARMLLAGKPPNHALAARLFQALQELRGLRSARARQVDDRVLAPTIHRWSRRDKAQVAALLKWQGRRVGPLRSLLRPDSLVPRGQRRPDLSDEFKLWCENENNARAGNSAIAAVISGGPVGTWRRHRRQPARNDRRDDP